ncbi:hypothetical protein AAMO2058_001578100 [Amorphochlora amoebiformis]
MCVDPTTGIITPYLPYGRYLHIAPLDPTTKWATDFGTPWWKDEKSCIGKLSKKPRKLTIVNTLTSQEHTLEVASEETINEIQTRYLKINGHADSYTWKRKKKPMNMNKTLEQNGVIDESDELNKLGIGENAYTPVLHLYFNDDLTVA